MVGAARYRDPDHDLPHDFEARRLDYYAELRKPLDPARFVAELRADVENALTLLNDDLPRLAWVDIRERGGAGVIRLSPLDAQAEPQNLRRVKHEVSRRWHATPLIDVLKEALLRSGALPRIAAAVGSSLPFEVLAERLILAIYGYGTNAGIRAVIPPNGVHSEEEVR